MQIKFVKLFFLYFKMTLQMSSVNPLLENVYDYISFVLWVQKLIFHWKIINDNTLNIKIDDFMIESKECIFEIFIWVSIDSKDIN